MKLERKLENFTRKTLMNLEHGDVFLKDLEGPPYIIYGDKDCETRYLNLKNLCDEDMTMSLTVFVCDASLSYCVRSSP